MKRLTWPWDKLENMYSSREGRAATNSPTGQVLHTCRGHQSQKLQLDWCIQVLCHAHPEHLSMVALTQACSLSSSELRPQGKVWQTSVHPCQNE